MDALSNFAYGNVTAAPSPATSGSTFTVSMANAPAVPFNLVVWPSEGIPTAANAEIVRVVANASGVLTTLRQQEETSARAITIGDQVMVAVTKRTLTDLISLSSAGINLGGTSGVTGYIGPLISTAISTEGMAEANFLEAVEQYFDGCTPEVALKPEVTYAGTTNPKKANISNFLALYKATGTKKRWRGHTLLWWQGLAKWMETFSGTEAEYEEQMIQYVKDVVTAVGQRVDSWDVLNELTNSGALRQCVHTENLGKSLTVAKGNRVMQFYARCIRAMKEANPSAKACVNEYEVETAFNYSSGAQRGEVFLLFVKVLQELEAENPALYAAPDVVGFQCHTNTKRNVGSQEADIKNIVPKYTALGLDVEITELDVEMRPGDAVATQAQLYEEIVNGAKKAGIGRVTIWGVTDKRSWIRAQWEASFALKEDLASGAKIPITKPEEKQMIAVATKASGGTGQVQVRFDEVTPGVGFATGTTYYIVGSNEATGWVELSATEGGAAISVTGTLKKSNTKIKKWASQSAADPYPNPLPFNYNGEPKAAWRAVERTRPEQPGISEWKSLVELNAKVTAGTGSQIPQARTQGLDGVLKGTLTANATVTAPESVGRLPAGMRPTEERQIGAVVGGKATFLIVGTNGFMGLSGSDSITAAQVIKLDGLRFPLS